MLTLSLLIILIIIAYYWAKRHYSFNRLSPHNSINGSGNEDTKIIYLNGGPGSKELIKQSMSRKFLYNNPSKLPKLPLECKYHASPIVEQKSENYNTYDES